MPLEPMEPLSPWYKQKLILWVEFKQLSKDLILIHHSMMALEEFNIQMEISTKVISRKERWKVKVHLLVAKEVTSMRVISKTASSMVQVKSATKLYTTVNLITRVTGTTIK